MGVYEVELDSGGKYIQEGLGILTGAIASSQQANRDAPGLTKKLVESLFAEGKMMPSEDMWALIKRVYPKADRDTFESIYFGRVLPAEERTGLMSKGILPQGFENTLPQPPAAPAAGAPAGQQPTQPAFDINTILPKGQVSSGSVAPPPPAPPTAFASLAESRLSGEPAGATTSATPPAPIATGNTAVDSALQQASGVTAGVTTPKAETIKVESAADLERQFQQAVSTGTLTPEKMESFMAYAQKGFGDWRSTVNQYVGYDPLERARKYGMSDSAARSVMNGIVSQLAGVRDMTKESAVLQSQLHQISQNWANWDQKNKELAASIISMTYNLKASLRNQDITKQSAEFDAKFKEASIELQKLGIQNDTAKLVLTAAGLLDDAAGGGRAGTGAGRGGTGIKSDLLEVLKFLDGHEQQVQAALSLKGDARTAALARLKTSQQVLWAMVMKEDPQVAALAMAYVNGRDLYTETDAAQMMGSIFRDVPKVKEALDPVLIAPTRQQRQAALTSFFATVEPEVQNYIDKSVDPSLQGFYRDMWKMTKERGMLGVFSNNVSAAMEEAGAFRTDPTQFDAAAGRTTEPGSPRLTASSIEGQRTAPVTETTRSTVWNALTGSGTPTGFDETLGVPASRDWKMAQDTYADSILEAARDANTKYLANQPVQLTPMMLATLIDTESKNWDPNSKSPKGAIGLTQLMEPAAKEVGISDRANHRENIIGGARYFAKQLARFGDLKLALIAYNAGPEVAAKVQADANTQLPKETVEYLARFDRNFNERRTRRTA